MAPSCCLSFVSSSDPTFYVFGLFFFQSDFFAFHSFFFLSFFADLVEVVRRLTCVKRRSRGAGEGRFICLYTQLTPHISN